MSRRYAADTSVPMDRSISEVRTTVRRHGASEFAHMESDTQAAIVSSGMLALQPMLVSMPMRLDT